jgi:hypothetical protein
MIEGGRRLHAQQDLAQQVTELPLAIASAIRFEIRREPFPTLRCWDAAKSAKT